MTLPRTHHCFIPSCMQEAADKADACSQHLPWYPINDHIDMRRDGPHNTHTEVGPNWPTGFTWSIIIDGGELEWGNAPDLLTAITEADDFLTRLGADHTCNRRLRGTRGLTPTGPTDCAPCALEQALR